MEFIKVMEGITLLVTLVMFSTGFFPCRKMYETKSTRNVPYHMFLLGLLGCMGMFHYGIMLGNKVLIFINGVGAALNTLYTFLYLHVVKSKTKPLVLLMLATVYFSSLYSYMYFTLTEPSARADTLGTCSSLLTTFTMALPALEVIQNIRYKNADGMPPVMLIGGIACSLCWLIYGIMLDDPNVYSPNIPGIFVASVKLFMIFLYGSRKHSSKID